MELVIHGGAKPTSPNAAERQSALDEIVAEASNQDRPLDAVESALNGLEESPLFNAGRGGAIEADGVVRTDAGLMTSSRQIGAVCAMPGVVRSSSVARVILEETPYILIDGEQAVRIAESYGIETGQDLRTPATEERWGQFDVPSDPSEWLAWSSDRFSDQFETDTVGAVASDGSTIVAGTSTGGRWFAYPGRIGDVPQVGCGFYCSTAGGASVTGSGEETSRVTLAQRAVAYLEQGASAQEAADSAMGDFDQITGSQAGVIVLDRDGNIGVAYNSEEMLTSQRQ